MITPGTYDGYDYDRMIVRFSVLDDEAVVPCAISTSAMDDLDNCKGVNADGREAQFMRLRTRIEAQVAIKIGKLEFEGTPRGVVLRSLDFSQRRGVSP